MEKRGTVWLLIGILLFQLRHAAAQNKTDIPKHVNLSPFWGWISAAECLLKYQKTSKCRGNAVLTLAGTINVEQSEAKVYCDDGGCGKQTQDVLDCINSVKRDFRFANNAKVGVVYDAISNGCKALSAISPANYTTSSGSAMKLSASSWIILFLSMAASMILHFINNT